MQSDLVDQDRADGDKNAGQSRSVGPHADKVNEDESMRKIKKSRLLWYSQQWEPCSWAPK